MDLKNITHPIRDYLELFDKRFSESVSLEGFFIDDISEYILKQSGKKIRPILTFLSAKITKGVTSQTIRCALILELIHTASLIHDDVIDDSEKRRGKETLNFIWGNNAAVLYGDYIYGKCLEVIETESDFKLLPTLAKITSNLPLGELMQKDVSERLDYSEESYFKVISNKTAAMMEVAAEIGAMSAGAETEDIQSLKSFGYYMGLAFQIRDDILDYFPEFNTGKPFGNDIKEKKITLPLIFLLNESSQKDREEILNFIKQDNKKEKDILNLINRVRDEGFVDRAEEKVMMFCNLAEIQLNRYKDTDAKSSLIELLHSSAKREN
ncbi:MAG: polyprenyl synthetase family protein [Bacteroidales bacterium]|jgi:octaprenyl-diphosphate synthase|nr:polyprenyl synthetase family protein [Bacteroidales bacterium]MDX9798795.1 polyprenyl synthetase family protein [Bacteroidales bacterium]